MEITWCTVDFKTGARGGEVKVAAGAQFERIIATATTTTVQVRCSDNGVEIAGWDESTDMARTMLVAVDKDGDQILFGAMVLRRTSDITSPWVSVTLTTIEAYFDRRYINTELTWTDADPAQVAVDVLGQITDLPPLTVDAKMTGNNVIDGFYRKADDKQIGAVLRDLTGLTDGIEWTVDLQWADADHTAVQYVARISPRLGTAAAEAGSQWTMPGCITGGEYIEDASADNFANDVTAVSSGEGESRPESTRYEATELLTSYARFERRFTPATSVTSTATLNQYAEAELARTRLGATQLSITANLDAAPQVNRDWWMGDDIDVSITSDRFPARVGADGYLEPGYVRRLRTVGWKIDTGARTITPSILEAL